MKNNKFLPLSKSWAIRMIFLDMLYGAKTGYQVLDFFKKQKRSDLADDIGAALDCAIAYISGKNIFRVGNSGTVCRFLIYMMEGKRYKLEMGVQLRKRIKKIPANLRQLSVKELLKFGTSQYASAALLMGAEPVKNLHPKCALAMGARKEYFKNKGKWVPRYDEVIIGQLENFLHGTKIKNPIAEDYCYLRAFGLMTHGEGKRRWPELAKHESNRLKVMERICKDFKRNIKAPDDHRVVMAVALRQKSLGLPIRISNKKCVSKSWPQFWQWLENHN